MIIFKLIGKWAEAHYSLRVKASKARYALVSGGVHHA
jgi:hypothetical protein